MNLNPDITRVSASAFWRRGLALLPALWLPLATAAPAAYDAPGNFNPIVPGYFADPTIKKFGDTYYLYATTDGNGGGRGPATVWVSKDFVNWTLVPMNWPKSPVYWAPDIEKVGNRYYHYYNQPCLTFGAVGDSPIGPWEPLGGDDGLVVPNYLVKDVITLDGQLFQDKSGGWYMYWGTWGIYPNSGCGVGSLNPDMKSFSKLGKIPNTQAKDFFEAPFMLERNGVYYFMYSSGDCGNSTYRVQYAVGDKPDGEFKMGPNNPILSTTEDHSVDGPGHHSVLQEGNDYYIIYHRHDVPFTPNGMARQTCASRLVFGGDGVIEKVEPTHEGIGYLAANTEPSTNLAFGKKVTADSFYQDTLRQHDFKPDYAVDDNNATLWRPADNKMGHWLTVDLGKVEQVRRVLTQFEYATWFYQYRLEYSLDGNSWKIFSDRTRNTRWGSPLVDHGDVAARYLRLTVTGVEKPGLFGAVWNIKVYGVERVDPLETMADRAFADYVAPSQARERPQAWTATASSTTPQPVIRVEAAAFAPGAAVNVWTNLGSLGGAFRTAAAAPQVAMTGGRKGVRFSGHEMLASSFVTPRALTGNSSFTVALWVNNPQIADNECLVSWAGHGGPDAMTAQIDYGSNPRFGAVGHWGFADMGFRGAPPKEGDWHHLAVVFDGVVERVYVDGVLNNSSAKMLLMNEGQPMYLGASAPGADVFNGFLASLCIYDTALDAAAVKRLAADAPEAEVAVQSDSARLDYGALSNWPSEGSVGGNFGSVGQPPVVADVAGRIAVRFKPGQIMESSGGLAESAATALVATVRSAKAGTVTPLELINQSGAMVPLTVSLPDTNWHQVAFLRQDAQTGVYVDGVAQGRIASAGAGGVRSLRLGGTDFDGALARVQAFLKTPVPAELFKAWQGEWMAPAAGFATPPVALDGTLISMTARAATSLAGGVEYCFTETAGHPGGRSSGWIPEPFFLNDGLLPNTNYAYTVKVRDAFGNVSAAAPAAEATTDTNQFTVITDAFGQTHDYLAGGTEGTPWNGLVGKGEGSTADVVAATNGVLRLQSRNSVWDGGRPLGPFLYQNVTGDFVVQVKVADYAGLASRQPVGNNDGSLMVRLANSGMNGRGQNLVQLSFFPPWNQGNIWSRVDRRGRYQKGNLTGFNANRYLQIIHRGAQFFFRTSPDGHHWVEMPESPIEQTDMAGQSLQVGLAHAAYGELSSYISFSDYQLTIRK